MVDVRLPGKGNSTSHGARPVHQIISKITWIWTSRASIKNSLSPSTEGEEAEEFTTAAGGGWTVDTRMHHQEE
jgi:hypothetical protein